MIEAEELTKYYGNVCAIENVSFRVNPGEIVGFLGPNGAGKTTAMRILSCFMPASGGTARIAGYDIHTQSLEVRRRIGYMPETVPLYRDMTVRSYLQFFGSIRGMDSRWRESRIREVMDICRIDNYAQTRIGKLSKGYRQLVGIAQAILHEPEVLILDEPTIGIDARQVVQIRQLIEELGGEHTVILSSHILPEVSMICERVIIMDRGRIVALDSAENLSAKLKGIQLFEIEARGPTQAIKEKLEGVRGVLKVIVEGAGDVKRYRVECEPGEDIRDELVSSLVTDGYGLLGLRSSEMSLEDIFLELTREERER